MFARKIISSFLFFLTLSASHTSLAVVEKRDEIALQNYRAHLQELPANSLPENAIDTEISRLENSGELDEKLTDIIKLWHEKLVNPSGFQDLHEAIEKMEKKALTSDNSAEIAAGGEDEQSGFKEEYCGHYGARLSCCAPSGTGGSLAGGGVGTLFGTAFGMLAGAMTGMAQSMSEHFDWNRVWIVGGSVGGSTLLVCAGAGGLMGAGIGWWKGPVIWNHIKNYFAKEPRALTFKEMVEAANLEDKSEMTLKHFELIYNNLIKELPLQEV